MACFRSRSSSKGSMKNEEEGGPQDRELPQQSVSSRMEPSTNEVSSSPTLNIYGCDTFVDPTLGFQGSFPSSFPRLDVDSQYQANSPVGMVGRGVAQTTIPDMNAGNDCYDCMMANIPSCRCGNSLADFDPKRLGTILAERQRDNIERRIEVGDRMAVSDNEESGFNSYNASQDQDRISDSNTIVHNFLSDHSSDSSSVITDGSITHIRGSSTEYFTVDTGYDTSKAYTTSSTDSVFESDTSGTISYPDIDAKLRQELEGQQDASPMHHAFHELYHVDPGLNELPGDLGILEPPDDLVMSADVPQPTGRIYGQISDAQMMMKLKHRKSREQLLSTQIMLDKLQSEHSGILRNLDTDKKLAEQLKDSLTAIAVSEKGLRDQVKQLQTQVESRLNDGSHDAEDQPPGSGVQTSPLQSMGATNKDITVLKQTAGQLRCEIDRLKQLLTKSEQQVQSEIDRMKDVNNHVMKLTQVRSLLQQQLEVAWGGMPESEEQLSIMEAELAEKESTLIKVTSQYHEVDTELNQKKQDLYYHKQHIAGLQNQIEKSESHHRDMVRNLHEKDTIIINLESNLREAKHEVSRLKIDYKQLKVKAEQAEEDNLKLTSINNLIENMLATEKCENSKNLDELNALRKKLNTDSGPDTERLKEQVSALQSELKKQAQKNMDLQATVNQQNSDSSAKTKNIAENTASRNSNDAQNDKLKEKLREKDNQLSALEKKIEEMSRTVKQNEKMVLEYSNYEEKIQESKRLNESHLSEIVMLKNTISKIREDLQTREEEYKALDTRANADLCHEREQVMTMTLQVQELEIALQANQATIDVKQETVNILQGEMEMLKKILDNQKRHLGNKFRRESLEIQEKIELRMSAEVNQLSVELEQAREQVNAKTQENLKFQQEVLSLESQLEVVKSQLSEAQKTLMVDEQHQLELNARLEQQKQEIKSLQEAMIKKAEEKSEAENKELLNEIKELTQQMQMNMEKQLASDTETREREMCMSDDFNKKLCRLEADLTTEKAIHKITRHSLEAQEEANNVLRQQLLKKKSSHPEKKMRDRNDEINAIISRSQVRAQAMLSPGLYLDGTLRHMNAPQDCSTNSSPDSTSDVSFRSTSPMYSCFVSKNNHETQNN